MPKKMYFTVPNSKYKKDYLKKNSKVLFIYDKEVPPGKKDYFDLSNVLGLDFSDIRNDSQMPENEKIIKKELKKMMEKSKKFTKIAMATGTIGLKLVHRKANQSYKVLSFKLRKFENIKSISKKNNNNDNDSLNSLLGIGQGLGKGKLTSKSNKKGRTKKKTMKQLKELESKSKRRILQPLKDSKNYCKECNKGIILLKKNLYTEESRESKKFIKALQSQISKCKQCLKKCGEVKTQLKNIKKNKSLYQVQYPITCKIDHTGKNKARRIKDDLNETLISQYKILNQE